MLGEHIVPQSEVIRVILVEEDLIDVVAVLEQVVHSDPSEVADGRRGEGLD